MDIANLDHRIQSLLAEGPGAFRELARFIDEYDLYSDDVTVVKDDELRVRYPARIDTDVGGIVRFNSRMYCIVDITMLDDGQLEYLLKR